MNEKLTICDYVRRFGGSGKIAKEMTRVGGVYISPQLITKWVRENHVSVNHVLTFCRLTGANPYELNPRVYPKELFTERS